MSLPQTVLACSRCFARRKMTSLLVIVLGLLCFTADIRRHDAIAAVMPMPGIETLRGISATQEAIPDSQKAKEKNGFLERVLAHNKAAWSATPLVNLTGTFAGFEPRFDESILQPQNYGGAKDQGSFLRAIVTPFSLAVPEFRDAMQEQKKRELLRALDIESESDLVLARQCLAEAVYFESRSEPERGQRAVAQVVLNRVKSRLYPGSICGVIYQNAHRRNSCQFSYACDGQPERVSDLPAWRKAKRIAEDALFGRAYLKDVGNATHYHADYVWPDWRGEMRLRQKIGLHIFYSMRARRPFDG